MGDHEEEGDEQACEGDEEVEDPGAGLEAKIVGGRIGGRQNECH